MPHTVLVSGAGGALEQALASRLGRIEGWELRQARTSTLDEAAASDAVAGAEQLVLVLPDDLSAEGGSVWLDAVTHRPYNLLQAAAQAGVRRCVIVSSMEVFAAVPPHLAIQPDWARDPSCEPTSLGPALAEFCADQFTRGTTYNPEGGVANPHLNVQVVRLGRLADDARAAAGSRWWCTLAEAVDGIEGALTAPLEPAGTGAFGARHIYHHADEGTYDPPPTWPPPGPRGPAAPSSAVLFGARGMMVSTRPLASVVSRWAASLTRAMGLRVAGPAGGRGAGAGRDEAARHRHRRHLPSARRGHAAA